LTYRKYIEDNIFCAEAEKVVAGEIVWETTAAGIPKKKYSVDLVFKRTIPTEGPTLAGEVIATFADSGQSSWLQIQRSRFDSRRYNIF
jgi:hypothetical protein